MEIPQRGLPHDRIRARGTSVRWPSTPRHTCRRPRVITSADGRVREYSRIREGSTRGIVVAWTRLPHRCPAVKCALRRIPPFLLSRRSRMRKLFLGKVSLSKVIDAVALPRAAQKLTRASSSAFCERSIWFLPIRSLSGPGCLCRVNASHPVLLPVRLFHRKWAAFATLLLRKLSEYMLANIGYARISMTVSRMYQNRIPIVL